MGIYVPEDMTAVVIAAMEKWMTGSMEGREYIVNLFGFDWLAGSSDCTYDLRDPHGRMVDKLKPEQVFFIQAAVAKGEFVPSTQLTARPVDKTGCDLCGVLSHCTRTVDGKAICNRCLYHSDERDLSGGLDECRKCTAMSCEHHPSRERRMA